MSLSKPHHSRSYSCPNCHQGLRALKHNPRDFFCRSCRTAVFIVDHAMAVFMPAGGQGPNYYCPLDRLVARQFARECRLAASPAI